MSIKPDLIEGLVDYISQKVSLRNRLEKKKICPLNAKLAFVQLDKSRKGYLDLADVYYLCGEVTENQLFLVFKWLDQSKTGDVAYQDFIAAVTIKNPLPDQNQVDPVIALKILLSTFLQNEDYERGLKSKLGLTSQSLSSIYQSMCENFHKPFLTVGDIIGFLSRWKKWDSNCKQQIANMFKSIKNISQQAFLQTILSVREDQTPSNSPKNEWAKSDYSQSNEEQLLESISTDYLAQRPAKTSNDQGVNELIQQKYSKNLVKRQIKYDCYTDKQGNSQITQQKIVDLKNNDIDSLLSNIEKRREDLRKGSLERKKLIEEALSKKKNNISDYIQKSSHSNKYQIQQFYSKPASTPKAKTSFETYTNNFVGLHNNNFNKPFNLYKDQKKIAAYHLIQTNEWNNNLKNQSLQYHSPKNNNIIEKGYSSFQEPLSFRNYTSSQKQFGDNSFKYADYAAEIATNSADSNLRLYSTVHQEFYERPLNLKDIHRPLSINEVHQIERIRQKINHLPEKNLMQIRKEQKDIDRIIEKYGNLGSQSKEKLHSSEQISPKLTSYPGEIVNHGEKTIFSSTVSQAQSLNLRGCDLNNFETHQRNLQSLLIQDQKSRLNGIISNHRSSAGSLQKQNLFKRAEEEALRKIQEIQKKAKLKVLQKKSSVGFRWIK